MDNIKRPTLRLDLVQDAYKRVDVIQRKAIPRCKMPFQGFRKAVSPMDAAGKRRLEFLTKEVHHVVDYVRRKKRKWKVVYPE